MEIYFYLPAFILLCHLISFVVGKAISKVLYIFLAVIFLLVAGFREVGFDYEMYKYLYVTFKSKNWYQESLYYSLEVGYAYINHIAPSFQILVVVITTVIISVFFSFIYKNTKYPFLAIFVYFGIFFYTSLMGQYRQAFALGMVLLAINNIENRKKFLLFIIIAFSFHYTSVVALILLFVPQKLYKFKYYIFALLISIFIAIVFPILFSRIASLTSYLDAKSSFYEDADYKQITGINSVMMIRFFLFCVCFYFRKDLSKIPKMHFFINIYFLSLIIYIVFSFMTAMASRASVYFSFFEIILATNLLYVLRKNLLLYIAVLSLVVTISILRQQNSFKEKNFKECFVPYSNWLIKSL